MKLSLKHTKLAIAATAFSLSLFVATPVLSAPLDPGGSAPVDTTTTPSSSAPTPTTGSAPCEPGGGKRILGFPTWYQYLKGYRDLGGPLGVNGTCTPVLNGINDVWLIVAAVIEILLRIAALAAIGFVVTGGIKFITGQGEPEKMAQARTTVINALIGLVIAVSAAGLVSFIAGKF